MKSVSVTTWPLPPDPPVVRIDKTELDNLEDQKDDATLRCIVDSNPPATITWRKEGLKEVFSPDKEIVFSPVTRHSAGLYSCVAQNPLGMSKPAYVDLDVKCKSSFARSGFESRRSMTIKLCCCVKYFS
jgi:hypothetical protein